MSMQVIFFMMTSLVFAALTFLEAYRLAMAKTKTISTVGRITVIDLGSGGRYNAGNKQSVFLRPQTKLAIVSYYVEGKYYSSKQKITTNKKIRPGDIVTISCYAKTPEKLFTKTYGRFLAYSMVTCLSLILCVHFWGG